MTTPNNRSRPLRGTLPLSAAADLAAVLREQGTPEDEIAAASADLLALAEWPAPTPTPDETRRLVARLLPVVPRPAAAPWRGRLTAPARLAGAASLAGEFWLMLRLVRAQVSLLRSSFWLASVVVAALGGLLTWAAPSLSRAFLLHLIGPLLAYIGVSQAFRAGGVKMLEFELACPPSPRQLTLARLAVVLAYDLALGLLLSLLLWPGSGAAFWRLSLHWLAPLLLGTGVTLLLSLRLPLAQAAALAYTGWLALLVAGLISQDSPGLTGAVSLIPPAAELALGLAGLALIAAVLALLPRSVAGLLPR